MRWVGDVLGVLLAIIGLVWILQGTSVLKQGFMAGHIQYAIYGLVALAIGIAVLVLSNRPRKTA